MSQIIINKIVWCRELTCEEPQRASTLGRWCFGWHNLEVPGLVLLKSDVQCANVPEM